MFERAAASSGAVAAGVNKNFHIRKMTSKAARFWSDDAGRCTRLGEFLRFWRRSRGSNGFHGEWQGPRFSTHGG